MSTLPTIPRNGAEALPAKLGEIQAEPAQNPARLYLADLAPSSRRTQASALRRIAELLSNGTLGPGEFPWSEIRPEHVTLLRASLIERGYAPATVGRYLAALRGVLQWCWQLGAIDLERLKRLSNVTPIRNIRLPAGRNLDRDELRALFNSCDASPIGTRDAALLTLAYAGGMRRGEIVALEVDDIDPQTGRIHVRHGKGDRERVVYVAEGGRAALQAWLEMRGGEPGAFLHPIRKGGRIQARRMTSQSVYSALRRRGRQAGVVDFSPHDLRRSMVGDLLDAGADLAAVQELCGHASPITTARYDRRGDRARKAAAERLTVPYRRER